MRGPTMSKLAGIALALIALAPLAAAQEVAEAALPTDIPAAEVMPEAAGNPVVEKLASAGSAAASVAGAIGDGLSTAASFAIAGLQAGAHLLASLGSALASGAKALGALLLSIVEGLAALLITGAALVRAHPKESAIVAGSAVGAGGLLYLLKRLGLLGFALPLYTRLAPSEMLDNEARAAVYEHIKQNPGAHPSAIAEKLGLGWGTVVYHLARLESSKLVSVKEGSHRKCYFAVGGSLGQDERTALAAMSTDKAKVIVHAVRSAPGISQKDLAERLGMSQALASWHVKRLIGSGVLVSTKEGRSNCLRVAEHVPLVAVPTVPVIVAATA